MDVTSTHGHRENQDINNEVRPNDCEQQSSRPSDAPFPVEKNCNYSETSTDAILVQDSSERGDSSEMSKGHKGAQATSSNPSSRVSSTNASNTNSRSSKSKCKSSQQKIDAKARLEKSRQSARECRARKKLRYQYLEDLATKREFAVFALRKELQLNLDTLTKLVNQADLSSASQQNQPQASES